MDEDRVLDERTADDTPDRGGDARTGEDPIGAGEDDPRDEATPQ